MTKKKKVLLINDTTGWYHFGCTATSEALKLSIEKAGYDLDSISIAETYKITLTPDTAQAFLSEENFRMFCEANTDFIESIREADILMINGEGTLHGVRQAPLSLLYLAYASKKFLGKTVEIVNHSPYPQDDLSLDNPAIVDIYRLVYQTIDFAAVREPVSLELIRSLGGNAIQSFDCMPLYIREKYKPHGQKAEKTLLVAGSAAWLNLNIPSAERGEVQQHQDSISRFIEYINAMQDKGYNVRFLHCAEQEDEQILGGRKALPGVFKPAKDDTEFLEFIFQLDPDLRDSVDVIRAQTLDEWLGHIEAATMLVSGRFHHTIAASCFGTPFVVLNSNTPKIQGMVRALGADIEIVNYDDPAVVSKLMQRTEHIESGGNDQSNLNHLCSMSAANFQDLINIQTEWYTEDRMREILEFFLDEENNVIIAQTQFEHEGNLVENLRIAVGHAIDGRTAVLPINLHNNHWVGMIIRVNAQGEVLMIYVDPTGNTFETEGNAVNVVEVLQEVTAELNPHNPIPVLQVVPVQQQHEGDYNNCGPLTVYTLMMYATADLENLTEDRLIDILPLPEDGMAEIIRANHEIVPRRDEVETEPFIPGYPHIHYHNGQATLDVPIYFNPYNNSYVGGHWLTDGTVCTDSRCLIGDTMVNSDGTLEKAEYFYYYL